MNWYQHADTGKNSCLRTRDDWHLCNPNSLKFILEL